MSHCPVPTELHRTFVLPRQLAKAPYLAPAINCARANPPPASYRSEANHTTTSSSSGYSVVLAIDRPDQVKVTRKQTGRAKKKPSRREDDMGSCFSSSGSAGDDAAGYGEEIRRPRKVWPSDDDGGEWDVDNRAAIYIAKFHRHQSGVVCTDCAAADQQQTPVAQ